MIILVQPQKGPCPGLLLETSSKLPAKSTLLLGLSYSFGGSTAIQPGFSPGIPPAIDLLLGLHCMVFRERMCPEERMELAEVQDK